MALLQIIHRLRQDQKWTETDSTVRRKSGTQFPALCCTIHPLLDSDHKLMATLAVISDISNSAASKSWNSSGQFLPY